MIKNLYILSVILFLQGCQTIYVHPTKGPEDFIQDKYECEQTATQFSANYGAYGNPLIIGDEIKRCLEQKYGWQRCTNCKR